MPWNNEKTTNVCDVKVKAQSHRYAIGNISHSPTIYSIFVTEWIIIFLGYSVLFLYIK